MEDTKITKKEEAMSIWERAQLIGNLGREIERQLTHIWGQMGVMIAGDCAILPIPLDILQEAGIAAHGGLECYAKGGKVILQGLDAEDGRDIL